MIYRVHREDYEGTVTGLELPIRGDMNNGHTHPVGEIEDRVIKNEKSIEELTVLIKGLLLKVVREKKERKD